MVERNGWIVEFKGAWEMMPCNVIPLPSINQDRNLTDYIFRNFAHQGQPMQNIYLHLPLLAYELVLLIVDYVGEGPFDVQDSAGNWWPAIISSTPGHDNQVHVAFALFSRACSEFIDLKIGQGRIARLGKHTQAVAVYREKTS